MFRFKTHEFPFPGLRNGGLEAFLLFCSGTPPRRFPEGPSDDVCGQGADEVERGLVSFDDRTIGIEQSDELIGTVKDCAESSLALA